MLASWPAPWAAGFWLIGNFRFWRTLPFPGDAGRQLSCLILPSAPIRVAAAVEMNSADDRVVDLAEHEADAGGAIGRRPPIRFVVRRPGVGIVGRCKSPCQLPVSRLFPPANPKPDDGRERRA
jgi:hypothetical protein